MEILQARKKVAEYYREYRWNYLTEAILDGGHGEVWVDNTANPQVSMLVLPVLHFYVIAGDPTRPEARKLLADLPNKSIILFGGNTEPWTALARQVLGVRMIEVTRYAFTSEKLDSEHLRSLRDALSADYTLKQIDRSLAEQIQAEKSVLTEDHILTFDSLDAFLEKGFGYVILDGEQIVSIASTFVVCDSGIEIQINTHKDYEGRGLGTVVGAALILHALENGIDPSWDAATKTSAHLAKKLGYVEQGEYPMYIVFGSKLVGALLLGLRKIVRAVKKPR